MDGKGPAIVSGSSAGPMAVTKRDADMYLVYGVDLDAYPALGRLDFSAIARSGDGYSPKLLDVADLMPSMERM